MGRRCMFCDQDRKLTGDHVPPQWTTVCIPGGDDHIGFTYRKGRSDSPETAVTFRRVNQGKVDDFANQVCDECHPALTEAVEPRAAQLALCAWIAGHSATLLSQSHRRVAAWITRYALVSEYTLHNHVKHRNFPSNIYRKFWKSGFSEPPARSIIWVAHYAGSLPKGASHRSYRLFQEDEEVGGLAPDQTTGGVATFYVGHFAFQYLWVHDDRPIPGPLTDHWREAVLQLWPPGGSSLTWPPPKALDDRGFETWSEGHVVPSGLQGGGGAS